MHKKKAILLACLAAVVGITLACSTASSFIATETPIPPSATPIPTDTPIPLAATPTQIPPPPTGEQPGPETAPREGPITIDDNGSIQVVIDHEGGYQFSMPSDWIIYTEGNETFNTVDLNQNLQDLGYSEFLANMIQQGVRLVAVETNTDHLSNAVLPNMNVIYLEDVQASKVSKDLYVTASIQSLQQNYPGIVISDSGVLTNVGGLEYGLIVSQIQVNNEFGQYQQKQLQMIFTTQGGAVVVTMGCEASIYQQMEPIFQGIVDSVRSGTD